MLSTNIHGYETGFFTCRQGDTEADTNDLAEKIVAKLLTISEKSFIRMRQEYNDIISALDQAIAAENAFNTSMGLKDTISDIKNSKKKFIV